MTANGIKTYRCFCQSISGSCGTSHLDKTSQVSKHVSPMYLLNMFVKTKQRHHNLTQSEKITLATLITYVNGEGVVLKGYEAYPCGSLLEEYTGLSLRTIEGNRRTLQDKGWMKVITGKGDGNANHYFINAKKIAQAYVLSHPEVNADWLIGNHYESVKAVVSKIKRKTQGLKRGKQPSVSVPQPDNSPTTTHDTDYEEWSESEEVEMVC
jgi:hypothetical protein